MIGAFWTSFSPFRGMQDATRGTFEQQAAAYRHNRRMRKQLLACMARWAVSCAVAVALTTYFHALGSASGIFSLLAAAGGMFVTAGVCVLTLGACAYLHFAYDQR
jgi:hypothetical protein